MLSAAIWFFAESLIINDILITTGAIRTRWLPGNLPFIFCSLCPFLSSQYSSSEASFNCLHSSLSAPQGLVFLGGISIDLRGWPGGKPAAPAALQARQSGFEGDLGVLSPPSTALPAGPSPRAGPSPGLWSTLSQNSLSHPPSPSPLRGGRPWFQFGLCGVITCQIFYN